MIRTSFTSLIGLISLLIVQVQSCGDIKYDYESHPYQPYNYEHLDLALTLDNEHALVSGVATYTLSPKIDGLTTIYLKANELAIDGVSIDQEEVEYRVGTDSLIVMLEDTATVGESFKLTISWQSTSKFGLYRDAEFNFWSSKNPLAHHFWFPVFDHPRIETSFDAWFTIPFDTEVLFNGDLVEEAALASATQKRIHYQSDTPVPVTGLGFAMGDFVISEVTAGFSKVRLFSPRKGIQQDEREQLVREAARLKRQIENKLSLEYPWDALNIVVLPDNYWEERTYGTGTVFLYKNLGSLSAQLKRGIYAQWFGEYHRQEQFFDDAGNMDFMRTALHYSLAYEAAPIENPDTLNSIWVWNQWQKGFEKQELLVQKTVANSLPQLMREVESGVISFDEYAERWYAQTGLPWFELMVPEYEEEKEDTQHVKYLLDVFYDDFSGELDFAFSLLEGDGRELYSLNMGAYTFTDTTSHEILFTGEVDTVSFELSPSTEFISLKDGSVMLQDIEFGEFPLYFLLNQLRSSDVEDRLLAARLVSKYADNPDLQLAINDVLSFEENAEVKAVLYSTLSGITSGATGTEQQFLNGLSSADEYVVLSSLDALTNYPGNEYVTSSVRSKILRAESDLVFDAALKTYIQISKTGDVISVAQRLQRTDSTGIKTLKVMESVAADDTSGAALEIADAYLGLAFPFPSRTKALDLLLVYDDSPEHWAERLEVLHSDRDPRIRFKSLDGTKFLEPIEALRFLNMASTNEFDARLLFRIEELKNVLDE